MLFKLEEVGHVTHRVWPDDCIRFKVSGNNHPGRQII